VARRVTVSKRLNAARFSVPLSRRVGESRDQAGRRKFSSQVHCVAGCGNSAPGGAHRWPFRTSNFSRKLQGSSLVWIRLALLHREGDRRLPFEEARFDFEQLYCAECFGGLTVSLRIREGSWPIIGGRSHKIHGSVAFLKPARRGLYLAGKYASAGQTMDSLLRQMRRQRIRRQRAEASVSCNQPV
jgi:hypothetical protein